MNRDWYVAKILDVNHPYSSDKAKILVHGYGGQSHVYREDENLRLFELDFTKQTSKLIAMVQKKDFVDDRDSGCGAYFFGARIIPDTSKIMLFFKKPKVKLIDYASGAPSITPVFDDSLYQGGSCAGALFLNQATKHLTLHFDYIRFQIDLLV